MPTKREKKEMEHPEAPSGYVTLYNYKEPFMKFEAGYGFQGVLLFDGKEDTIQCHFCGEWFMNLANHIHKEHNMTAGQYKENTGLLKSTALISEKMRERLLRDIEKRSGNLVPGKKKTQAIKDKISKTSKKNFLNLERRNTYGTCPLQLLERIRKAAERLGRTPTKRELGGNPDTFKKVFGSMKEAFRRAGIQARKPGQNVNYKANIAGLTKRYTKEALIQELKDFEKRENRYPSHSDCVRRLLPSYNTYRHHFGTFREALEGAFPKLKP